MLFAMRRRLCSNTVIVTFVLCALLLGGIVVAQLPFRVKGGAAENSLVLAPNGGEPRVGIGTDTPETDLHIFGGGPAEILLQDDSGMASQQWKLIGSEDSFIIGDNTGMEQPFTIEQGASTDSLVIDSSGAVNVDSALNMNNSSDIVLSLGSRIESAAQINIGTTSNFLLLGADSEVQITDDTFNAFGPIAASNFRIPSDRNLKKNFEPIDGREILEKLAKLPITSWAWKEGEQSRHIGPTAQDWAKAFGYGKNNTSIGLLDGQGVALAAIQELHRAVVEKDRKIAELEARLLRLEELLVQ